MVVVCVVKQCHGRSGRNSGKSFHRLPAVIKKQGEQTEYLSRKRRDAWLAQIDRPDIPERSYAVIRVCSDHFISGKPSPLYSTGSPDWAPTLNLGHDIVEPPLSKRAAARLSRYLEQKRQKLEPQAPVNTGQPPEMVFSNVMPVPLPVNTTDSGSCIPIDLARIKVEPPDPVPVGLYTSALSNNTSIELGQTSSSTHENRQQMLDTDPSKPSELIVRLMGPSKPAHQRDQCQNQPASKDVWCQSDVQASDFLRMEAKLKFIESSQKRLCRELSSLHRKLLDVDLAEEALVNSEKKVKFYTGFDSFEILKRAFDHVSENVKGCQKVVGKFQEFLITLIILRINASFGDVAHRFKISESTVSEIFQNWMGNLAARLRNAVHWPARTKIQENTPEEVRLYFLNCDKIAVIVDCLEVFTGDSSLSSGEAGFSVSIHNKDCSTRFLLAMDPSGMIMCMSNALAGDITDAHLIKHCSLSENLLPGDWVLADEKDPDMDSSESQFNCCTFVACNSPTFESHLSTLDLNSNGLVIDLCHHVRSVSGQLRDKYQILQRAFPMAECVPVDQVVFVCAALSNLTDVSYFDQSS